MIALMDQERTRVVQHFSAELVHVAATSLDRWRLLNMSLEAVVADQAQVAVVVRC